MQEHDRLPSRTDDPSREKARALWQQPLVTELPKLTDLTLLTGGIPGGGDPGGPSTVF